ncbi:MAG: C25 family cysteine peptidase [Caldilineales bacterium]
MTVTKIELFVLFLVVIMTVSLGFVPAASASQPVDFRQIRTESYSISSNSVSVPGASLDYTPGRPVLPIKGYSVLVPQGSNWELSYDSPEEQLLPQLVTLPPGPSPLLNLNTPTNWLNDPASVPSSVPVTESPDPTIYNVNEFYPSAPVIAGDPVRQDGQTYLPIRVFPFQYNPVTRQLRYHPVLNITVHERPVSGQPNPTTESIEMASPSSAVPEGASGVQLRIHTTQRGVYRLTYDDLASNGVDVGPGGSNPNDFAMFYKGQPIAIDVTGAGDNSFDPGDLVVFYAVPYDLGRYQDYNVYFFAEDAPAFASRMTTRSVTAPFTPATASTITQTAHVEVNVDYRTLYERPNNADHFFDTQLYATSGTPQVTRSYNLALDDPVTTTGVIDLTVLIHGGNDDFAFNPDQSVDVKINSHLIDRYQWDGSVDYLISETLPASTLDALVNNVSLVADLTALPGISSYWISPDWVDLAYPAWADAEGNALYIASLTTAESDVVATGFTADDVQVMDVADPQAPVLLTGSGLLNSGGDYTVYWREPSAASTYYLASPAAHLTPSAIEFDTPSDWASNAHSFDYVAIIGTERKASGTTAVGDELSAAIQPLLAHRAAEGFTVAGVSLEDIYDEFSYGFIDPEAIRSFLSHAYHDWSGPPSYVLLVGDGHPGYRGEFNTSLRILVPPYLVHVDPWIGEVPADSRFASVDGDDDILPDMAIGRISANSAADVTAVVNKILAYEDPSATPDGDWQRRSVYVADNCTDPAGNFHALSNSVRQDWLPAYYDDHIVYYDAPPANCPDPSYSSGTDMGTGIKSQFNAGALFLQWFGHGSTVRWGSVNMFRNTDVATLLPTNQLPLTMHNACWTGYFVLWVNNLQTLGESLVNTPGRGAIADYSPSGLHIGAALLTLDQGMHKAMFQDRIPRAGDVVNASKYYFFDNSLGYYDLIDSMIFFGDPALKLRLPTADFSDSTMDVSDATADPGATLDYTVTVSNTSVFTAPNVTLTADYPQNLVTVVDAGGAVDNGDTLTWTLSDVRAADADSVVKTFSLAVNNGLPPGLYNVTVPAEIASDLSSAVQLQVNTEVNAAPLMVNSTLDVQRPWIPPGLPITVTATLLNYGTAPSLGTQVTLTLPSELGGPTWMAASTGPDPVYDPGARQVLWTGDVTIGSDETVSFSSVVSPTLTACGTFTVTGEVTDTLGVLTPLDVVVNLAVPDVNCTGNVDVIDVQLVAGRWGATLGQPEFVYQYDLNGNDEIDINDIIIAANLWQ